MKKFLIITIPIFLFLISSQYSKANDDCPKLTTSRMVAESNNARYSQFCESPSGPFYEVYFKDDGSKFCEKTTDSNTASSACESYEDAKVFHEKIEVPDTTVNGNPLPVTKTKEKELTDEELNGRITCPPQGSDWFVVETNNDAGYKTYCQSKEGPMVQVWEGAIETACSLVKKSAIGNNCNFYDKIKDGSASAPDSADSEWLDSFSYTRAADAADLTSTDSISDEGVRDFIKSSGIKIEKGKYTPEIDLPGGSDDEALTAGPIAFTSYIDRIYFFVTLIIGILGAMMFVIGGFQYLTSAGNQAMVGEAKNTMIAALSGIIIVLCSYLLLRVINKELVELRDPSEVSETNNSQTQKKLKDSEAKPEEGTYYDGTYDLWD